MFYSDSRNSSKFIRIIFLSLYSAEIQFDALVLPAGSTQKKKKWNATISSIQMVPHSVRASRTTYILYVWHLWRWRNRIPTIENYKSRYTQMPDRGQWILYELWIKATDHILCRTRIYLFKLIKFKITNEDSIMLSLNWQNKFSRWNAFCENLISMLCGIECECRYLIIHGCIKSFDILLVK